MPTTTPFNNLITFSRGSNATVTGSNGLIQWAPNNLLTFSEQFDNAAWTKAASSVVANNAVAPDETATADKLLDNAAFTEHGVWASMAVSNNVLSVYAKAAELSVIYFRFRQSSGQALSVAFDLANGTVCKTTNQGTYYTSGVGSIQAVGNGWYRCSVYVACAPLTANVFISLSDTNNPTFAANGDYSYTGTGTSGVLLWGAQLELGSTATTYNPTTVKNLLGFSEAFDNAAWAETGASIVTGAQANPINGLFNAQKLMEDTSTGDHRTFQAASVTNGTPYVFSAYVKPAGRTLVNLTSVSGALMNVTFDVSTGVITSTTNGVGSIVSVGSGWYRIAVTATATSTASANFQIRLLNNAPALSYTGDGNSGVYIYGAQLSDSASLDPYVPTPGTAPSSTAFYGPRFDYDPVTLQPRGILIEEQRTNLLLQSEAFGTTWLVSNATISSNVATSPDGTSNADKLVDNTNPAQHFVYQSVVKAASNITYTLTSYMKSAEYTSSRLFLHDGAGNGFQADYNLATGTAGAPVATGAGWSAGSSAITPAGNGWYRCVITATSNTAVSVESRINVLDAAGNANFTGTGTSGIFIYGAQLEAGAFATSYIPTVASTVTRSADVATITGQNFAQWYRQDEGVFVGEASFFGLGKNPSDGLLDASNGSANETIAIYRTGAANNISGAMRDNGADQAVYTVPLGSQPIKAAFAYAANNTNFAQNGTVQTTDTVCTVPTPDRLLIGAIYSAGNFSTNGHIRNIRFIPARAADFQLQALST